MSLLARWPLADWVRDLSADTDKEQDATGKETLDQGAIAANSSSGAPVGLARNPAELIQHAQAVARAQRGLAGTERQGTAQKVLQHATGPGNPYRFVGSGPPEGSAPPALKQRRRPLCL